ncbi:MAG: MATE family efflux transporter [Gammaproteobacteria bacterium]|nr:MATE family efflux transporter [Gammaproteobacteria bacterium]
MIFKQLHLYRDTLQELVRLSVPMMISQGAFAVMIFTDRYFLSQIDSTQMAAALGGGVASYFSISLFIGVLGYANALVAQYYGAGDLAKCPRVVTQGFIMTLLCIPALLIITYGVGGIFAAMGHDPRLVELEKTFFYLMMVGSVFNLSKSCLAYYFSGIGRTRIVMITDVTGTCLNIPLAYLLIFGKLGLPAWGIAGAAIATVISNFAALLLYLLFYFQREHRHTFQVMQSFKLDLGIMRRYIKLGLPSGVELFLNVAAFNLFLLMFQSYGIAQGAAATIVLNWDILSFVPMLGLNVGIISLTGRFVGSRNMHKADEVIFSGFLLGLGYSSVLALIFLLLRGPLVDIFTPPAGDFQAIRELGTFMMVGLATYAMADAVILITGGVLRGAGDTRWLMLASVALHWLMLIAQYFIIRVFGYGPKVSWVGFVLLVLSIALVYYLRLRGNKWRDPETLERVMQEHG